MKILLTGHLGYLGTQFTQRYGKDYEIVGYVLKEGDDLLDYPTLENKIKGCDAVVHLAAIPKPVEGKSFDDYFHTNVEATNNVARAAVSTGLNRIVYASSTSIYGIERGIPFQTPIKENQPFVSQYIPHNQFSGTRDVDLSYHMSKVMAEQIMAWYGLNMKIQTVALRFGPVGKVFLGTSVSDANAAQAINLSLKCPVELWYEPFSIVDEIDHIDISKAKEVLGYKPEKFDYPADKIRSTLNEKPILHETA
jgi:nucleoside-diphosphate-sugar epimerase